MKEEYADCVPRREHDALQLQLSALAAQHSALAAEHDAHLALHKRVLGELNYSVLIWLCILRSSHAT